ncbi:MAG: hypothetical protein AB7V56_03405 [Candidatus Nitrosocosmicus sp.]
MTIIIRSDFKFTDLLKNSLRSRYENRKRSEEEVHVSDILPSTCIRKQYYGRKFPDFDPLSEESVHHFIRGESSEFVITDLANMGVAQADLEFDGLIAHPDILDKDVIVELKDTQSTRSLDITDQRFKSYLRQLLYYLTITGIEKGIISIRYSSREMRWIKSDEKGDYFFRPFNGKGPHIESWSVLLPKDDIARELFKNEMMRRKNLFVKALKEADVSVLPRLNMKIRNSKCPYCVFYHKCMNEDEETEQATKMANEVDLLDIPGLVDFKPF